MNEYMSSLEDVTQADEEMEFTFSYLQAWSFVQWLFYTARALDM